MHLIRNTTTQHKTSAQNTINRTKHALPVDERKLMIVPLACGKEASLRISKSFFVGVTTKQANKTKPNQTKIKQGIIEFFFEK